MMSVAVCSGVRMYNQIEAATRPKANPDPKTVFNGISAAATATKPKQEAVVARG
jgi:hypothetical protein